MEWIEINPINPHSLPELHRMVLWWNNSYFEESTNIWIGCLDYSSYKEDNIIMFTKERNKMFEVRDLTHWMPYFTPEPPKEKSS